MWNAAGAGAGTTQLLEIEQPTGEPSAAQQAELESRRVAQAAAGRREQLQRFRRRTKSRVCAMAQAKHEAMAALSRAALAIPNGPNEAPQSVPVMV